MEKFKLILQILLLSLFQGAVECLRDVHISVPSTVRLGHPATLYCEYELDNDTLYTVKWYKGGAEFFRFTPKEKPAVKVFPALGIDKDNIIMAESNGTQVHFMKTAIAMSGKYSCEVSADSPSFRTSVVYAEMEVIDPPKGRPVLSGLKAKYSLGDIIHANCSSPGSRPAVNLTWVLNGKSAPRKHVKHYREVTTTDLITSISTIKLHAREAHFPNGQLKLKCTASLHNLYWQTTEKSAELVRRTSTYGSSATSRNTNRIPNNNDIYETKPATNIITNDILVIPPSDFRSSEQPYSVYDNNGSQIYRPNGKANSIWKISRWTLIVIFLTYFILIM